MKILAGNPTGKAREEALKRGMGSMIATSRRKHLVTKAVDRFPFWAVDNGAFSAFRRGETFPEVLFLEQLERAEKMNTAPLFVVAPDIVAGGEESLALSCAWVSKMGKLPKALVIQDGMSEDAVKNVLGLFNYVFVGGSVDWKWRTAGKWVELAHKHGLPCHIGQCGQFKHLAEAHRLGADSVDSTSWVVNKTWHIVDDFRKHLEDSFLFIF